MKKLCIVLLSTLLLCSCGVKTTAKPTPKPTAKPTPTATPVPTSTPAATPMAEKTETTYILNKSSKKFHYEWCESVEQMAEKNKLVFTGSRDEVISKGYKPCKRCSP